VRRHARVTIARPLREYAGNVILQHLMSHCRHRHLDLRDVDVDALSGAPASV